MKKSNIRNLSHCWLIFTSKKNQGHQAITEISGRGAVKKNVTLKITWFSPNIILKSLNFNTL
jgi:hypothetical protein